MARINQFFFKENPFGNQGEKKGFSWQPNTLNLQRKESTKGMTTGLSSVLFAE